MSKTKNNHTTPQECGTHNFLWNFFNKNQKTSYLLYLSPIIWIIYQVTWLVLLDKIHYFSWGQVLNDTVVILSLGFTILLGYEIALKTSNTFSRFISGAHIRILILCTIGLFVVRIIWFLLSIFFILVYFYSLFEPFLYVGFFTLGLIAPTFISILLPSKIEPFLRSIKPYVFIILIVVISFIDFVVSPHRFEKVVIDNGKEIQEFNLLYQNDKFVFTSDRVFRAWEENYVIVSRKDRVKLTKAALDRANDQIVQSLKISRSPVE